MVVAPADSQGGRMKTLPGEHYCEKHQGNTSVYDRINCTLCKAKAEAEKAEAETAAIMEGLTLSLKREAQLYLDIEKLRERQRVLVKALDRVTTYYDGCINGVTTDNYQDVLDEASAALAAKEG